MTEQTARDALMDAIDATWVLGVLGSTPEALIDAALAEDRAAHATRDCPDHNDPIECACEAARGWAEMRRERYAAAIQRKVTDGIELNSILPEVYAAADAAMAVADQEQQERLHDRIRHIDTLEAENARLRAELSSVTFARNEGREGNLRMRAEIDHLRKEAAEVRAAALTEAADAVAKHTGNPIDANAQMLRRMAAAARPDDTPLRTAVPGEPLPEAAPSSYLPDSRPLPPARPDDTTPAVGDRYDSRDGGAPVTVTRLWNFQDGGAAVSFEWPDAKPVTALDTLPLDEFHRAYQPARPDDTTGA